MSERRNEDLEIPELEARATELEKKLRLPYLSEARKQGIRIELARTVFELVMQNRDAAALQTQLEAMVQGDDTPDVREDLGW